MPKTAFAPLAAPKIWQDSINSADYEALFELPGGRKLPVSNLTSKWRVRVHIHLDFYQHQSFGQAELFDPVGGKWNSLAALPGALMKSTLASSSSKASPATFEADMRALLEEAWLIFIVAAQ